MKKTILFSIIYVSMLYNPSVFCQTQTWKVLNLRRTLTSINFLTPERGFIFGGDVRYNTIDGGKNWTFTFPNFPVGNNVFFIDSLNGWSANSTNTLLKTTNGGVNWVNILTNSSNYWLTNVFFKNTLTGWASGIDYFASPQGKLIKTTNGGINWFTQNTNITNILTSIYFINENTGWVTGQIDTFAVTTNGGTNWNKISSGTGQRLTKVSFLDSENGWILGNPYYILRTTNGGQNWNVNTSNFGNTNDFYFIDDQTGWIACTHGRIWKTTTGGSNWFIQRNVQGSDEFYNLFTIYFKNQNTGWAVGREGIIIKTSNGGVNWINDTGLPNGNLSSVFFADNDDGWITSTINDGINIYGQIWKSNNSGYNWYPQYTANFDINYSHFASKEFGIAVGAGGNIIKTTNGGNNWNSQTMGNNQLNSVYLYNQSIGWIVGNNGIILKTIDGGNSWFNQSSNVTSNLYSIIALDSTTCYCVGENGIVNYTNDGGNTWIIHGLSKKNHIKIFFINVNTGFIISFKHYQVGFNYWEDNIIYRTTNGGVFWNPVYDNSSNIGRKLTAISFLDSLNGFVTDNKGNLLSTVNGGLNWNYNTNLPSNTSSFSSINFRNNIGWITGSNGVLLTTDNNIVGINNLSSQILQSFYLYQNYPNPFNPSTKIKFDLPKGQTVKLIVYDLLGREIKTIVNSMLATGPHEFIFDGKNFASGIYFYKIEISDLNGKNFYQVKQMVLLK